MITIINKKKTKYFKDLETGQMFILPNNLNLHTLARKICERKHEGDQVRGFNVVRFTYLPTSTYVLTYDYYEPDAEVIPVKIDKVKIEVTEIYD